MPIEQTSLVPLIYDFPTDTQIRIEPDGGEYRVHIKTDSSDWCYYPIELKQHDIKNLNTALQIAIKGVSSIFEPDISKLPENYDAKHYEALCELAEKGHHAFNKIFAEGALRNAMYTVLKTSKTIQISSYDFFIPWELLYHNSLEVPIDASYFWGMQYIISRNMIRAGNADAFTSPTIAPCPHIGVIIYDELSHVKDEELPMLKNLEHDCRIMLSQLPDLNWDRRLTELATFKRFLSKELQVLHFACHADEESIHSLPDSILSETILKRPFLKVSKEFSVEMDDFSTRDFTMGSRPLVILNACVTGTINPLSTSNWAITFWKHGARGILATEFDVPDWFAAGFIKLIYEELLKGKNIGEALLTARRRFLDERKNPLGLAYVLYSRFSIRIANPH